MQVCITQTCVCGPNLAPPRRSRPTLTATRDSGKSVLPVARLHGARVKRLRSSRSQTPISWRVGGRRAHLRAVLDVGEVLGPQAAVDKECREAPLLNCGQPHACGRRLTAAECRGAALVIHLPYARRLACPLFRLLRLAAKLAFERGIRRPVQQLAERRQRQSWLLLQYFGSHLWNAPPYPGQVSTLRRFAPAASSRSECAFAHCVLLEGRPQTVYRMV
jgi:hypothetical protein